MAGAGNSVTSRSLAGRVVDTYACSGGDVESIRSVVEAGRYEH
jgi:hypothetical protein